MLDTPLALYIEAFYNLEGSLCRSNSNNIALVVIGKKPRQKCRHFRFCSLCFIECSLQYIDFTKISKQVEKFCYIKHSAHFL